MLWRCATYKKLALPGITMLMPLPEGAFTLAVDVKPNKRESRIISIDPVRRTAVVEVAAPAHEGRANKELLRFLKKTFKRQVRLVAGEKSSAKLVRFY